MDTTIQKAIKTKLKLTSGANIKIQQTEALLAKEEKTEKRRWVVIALILCVLYYAALAFIKVPYVTIGILSFAYTFSTFEVVTIVFLIAMMIFMGVRKIPVLVFVPIGTTLFLSLAFRTFLHVLLP